jgi:hypothetical protein
MRLYCAPPAFRVAEAKAVAAAAGRLGSDWSHLIKAIEGGAPPRELNGVMPKTDRTVIPETCGPDSWPAYREALEELRKGLAMSQPPSKRLDEAGMPADRFRRLWAGWTTTKARLKVGDISKLDGSRPFWPVLAWEIEPASGETVKVGRTTVHTTAEGTCVIKQPWGENLTYCVERDGASFEPLLRLDPAGCDSSKEAPACAACLMGLNGLDIEAAGKRVVAWKESGCLGPVFDGRLSDLLRFESAVVLDAEGNGPRWPAVTLTVAPGEAVLSDSFPKGKSASEGKARKVRLDRCAWGTPLSCTIHNRYGVNVRRQIELTPPGRPMERMASLLGLDGIEEEQALKIAEDWRPFLAPTLFNEALAAARVETRVVLKTVAGGLGWPSLALAGPPCRSFSWTGPDGSVHTETATEFQLPGVQWGGEVAYALVSQTGVRAAGRLRLLLDDPRTVWPAGPINWEKAPEQRRAVGVYVDDRGAATVDAFLREELARTLPAAAATPDHPLWRLDRSAALGGLDGGQIIRLLRAIRSLQSLNVALSRSTRTVFKYDDKGRGVGQETVESVRDNAQDFAGTLEALANGLWAEAGACPQEIQTAARKMIGDKLLERGRALRAVSPSPSADLRSRFIQPFLQSCAAFRQRGMLPPLGDTPEMAQLIREWEESPKSR